MSDMTRRLFFGRSLAIAGAGTLPSALFAGDDPEAPDGSPADDNIAGEISSVPWKPFSDRKVRVGIAGYGYCHFGGCFEFQHHPNVEIVAVAELFPGRRDALIKRLELDTPEKRGTFRVYDFCEDMIDRERDMDAVWIATDAPSHAALAVRALNRGLHVASAVPVLFGRAQLEDGWADRLIDAYRRSGRVYAMFETSAYRHELYAAKRLYDAGKLGKIVYTEGEYYHYSEKELAHSYTRMLGDNHHWRAWMPPMWYPTHASAFYPLVTGKGYTEVSCVGSRNPECPRSAHYPANPYGNPFGSEIAMFRTEDGGSARISVCWDLPGCGDETGRMLGTKGSFYFCDWRRKVRNYQGLCDVRDVDVRKPQLPPGVLPGEHGGSHGYLTDDFIRAVLLKRPPACDLFAGLNLTVPGIYAHDSALKDGERLKVPVFR